MSHQEALATIHRIAIERGLKIATAESLTAGMVSAALASLSGSSAYLLGGVAAYTIEAKVKILGVDREKAEVCNCVSEEVVGQMAIGARDLFGADCVIATTGYAEPCLDEGILAPFAFHAVLVGSVMKIARSDLSGLDRNDARRAVMFSALYDLALMLEAL